MKQFLKQIYHQFQLVIRDQKEEDKKRVIEEHLNHLELEMKLQCAVG